MFESTIEAIAVVDRDGIIQSVNRSAEHVFECTKIEMLGAPITLLLSGPLFSAKERWTGGFDVADLRKIAGMPLEVEGKRKDGCLIPIELSVAGWQQSGETFFTLVMRDISRRRRTEASLRASEERLRLLQDEFAHLARVNDMGEMAAAIAHEINQPLTAITNYLSSGLMVDGTTSDAVALADARIAMTAAVEQGLRAGKIVRGLWEFVRKGEGRRRVERADRLVEWAMALALIDAKSTGIHVERDAGAGAASVEVEVIQIQQVLVNLMRNAVEAFVGLPTKQMRISVGTRELPDQGMVEFCVSDNGSGIAPAIRDQLFDPFVTTKPNGMGMGLSVCRRIVEAHGGNIDIQANGGAGSTFKFMLPCYGARTRVERGHSRA